MLSNSSRTYCANPYDIDVNAHDFQSKGCVLEFGEMVLDLLLYQFVSVVILYLHVVVVGIVLAVYAARIFAIVIIQHKNIFVSLSSL